MPNEQSFLETMFHCLYVHHTYIDVERYAIPSVQAAISHLRKSLGITRERLSVYAGLTANQLLALESRGSPIRVAPMTRLGNVAAYANLPNLAEYFYSLALKARNASKPKRQSTYGPFNDQ